MTPKNAAGHPPAVTAKSEYKGTKVDVLEDVYEPAEDTYLMADCAVSAFSSYKESYQASKSGEGGYFVLEVGCGSGFVSAFFQNHFPDVHLTAVDINPAAVMCARMNGIRVFESDMFDIFENTGCSDITQIEAAAPIKPPLGFDVILFNPPYLPTSEDEKVSGMLNYAFDGGVTGRDSIDRFLNEVGRYLKDGGFFLLLISSITGLKEVSEEMEKNGFSAEVIGTDKVSFEELMVLKGKRI